MKVLGSKLKALRKSRRMSQLELSKEFAQKQQFAMLKTKIFVA